MRWKRLLAVSYALAICGVAFTAAAGQDGDTKPMEIRVVVVTTFEVGNDTGDAPGELQDWVEKYPTAETLPFPQGVHVLRYNAHDHVLVVLTGVGKSQAAASVTALGLDPRFDLRKAYWILAGIGGVDSKVASVGSAAWASHVVDGDLAYEIDARDAPADWPTGIVPYDRSRPFQDPKPPAVSDNGTLVYDLNDGLANWAVQLTRDVELPDDAKLKKARAGYAEFPNAQRAPFVLKGDSLTADRFWLGVRMTDWAEKWVSYWTHGKGALATSAEEDAAYLEALTRLAHAGRADFSRAMDLRTASDYTVPPKGVAPAEFLKSEATGNYAAYDEAIENAYRVGSVVVKELAQHWGKYRDKVPMAAP